MSDGIWLAEQRKKHRRTSFSLIHFRDSRERLPGRGGPEQRLPRRGLSHRRISSCDRGSANLLAEHRVLESTAQHADARQADENASSGCREVCDFFHESTRDTSRWLMEILLPNIAGCLTMIGLLDDGQGNGGANMSRSTFFVQECPTCGRSLQVCVEYLGRQVVCQHCHGRFEASESTTAARGSAIDLLRRADELLESVTTRQRQRPVA